MADPVKIAILGNSFASRVQLPALRWAGGSEVVGVAGRDADKARATAAEWELSLGTGDWRELVALDPDLVFVSTPVHLHHEMCIAALEGAAAVLCEKPFALNVGEAEDLVARSAGRAAWIDHQLRWSPHVRELARRLSAGSVGAPRHASLHMFLANPAFRTRPWSWWFDAERGGGVLGALGSHLIDLARHLLGDVEAVRGELSTFVPERPDSGGVVRAVTADEYAALRLRFASGWTMELGTAIGVPREPAFELQLTGEAGALRLVGGDRLYEASWDTADGEFSEVSVEPRLRTAEEYGMQEYGIFGRCLPLYLRDVVATVAAGETKLANAATFADGLAVQRVLDAARESARTGGGWAACG